VSVVERLRAELASKAEATAAQQAAEQAEADLAAQRQAAEVAEREARKAERERQAEQRRTETAAGMAIQRVSDDADEAIGRAGRLAAEAVVRPELRQMARAWRRGQLGPALISKDEPRLTYPPLHRLTGDDPALFELVGAHEHTTRSLGWIPAELGLPHELSRAVDQLECRLWAAVEGRIDQLALGEA
jgi:hypothetical protein